MEKKIKEVRNLARHNKKHIMYNTIELDSNGAKYPLIIKGVGAKAIKLELYIHYEDILNEHNSKVLESILWDKLNTVYPDTQSTTIGDKKIFY